MTCRADNSEYIKTTYIRGVLVVLVNELNTLITYDIKPVITEQYYTMLHNALGQLSECIARDSVFNHEIALETQRKLLLVKEPLLQLRFEVVDSKTGTDKVLLVFALHELYNSIAKLVDALHLFTHVGDQVNLDEMDFRTSIQKHLNTIFNRDG